jgi:hypothetical protein
MDLTKDQWTLIGIGAGGLVIGALGASLFVKGKPVDTGLSRLFKIAGRRKSEVAFYIKGNEDGYFAEFDAPYGISSAKNFESEDAEGADTDTAELADELSDEGPFPEVEDAAAFVDHAMFIRGYIPADEWLDSLESDLDNEKEKA